MPRDSNGNASTDPIYIAVPGKTIRAVQHNKPIADIIQMLTGSLARNGNGGMLADLAMGGFKITGLANGVSAQDAVTKAQLDARLDGLPKLGDLPQLGAWTNVASASTVNLGAQTSRNLVITGTTTITSFGTAGAADNVPYLLRFSGALTLTNGANLILPGGANIVTAADDIAVVVHDTASKWRVSGYSRAAMRPLVAGTSANNLVALDGAGKLPAVDGSQLTGILAGGIKNVRLIKVSGSVTPSAGVTKWLAFGVGGGGGSGSAFGSRTLSSGGGGGGGFIAFSAVNAGSSYSVSIGSGGRGGASGTSQGGTGGTTSLVIGGTTFTATGGGGSSYNSVVADISPGGSPGAGTGGLLNASGEPGGLASYAIQDSSPGNPGIGAFALGYGYGGAGVENSNGHGGSQGCLLILEF